MTAGHIYAVAGDGISGGLAGDGGAAASGRARQPGRRRRSTARAACSSADAGNCAGAGSWPSRDGTFYGQKMTTGTSTRRAGGGTEGISARACPVMAARPARRARGPGLGRDRRGGEPAAHRRRPGPAGRRRNGRFYGQAMTAAHIYTVAGMIEGGYSGDNPPAGAAMTENLACA